MSSVLSYDVTTRCLSLLFRSVASIICLLEYSFILCFTFCFTVFARHFTISSSFIWCFASSFCILVFHGSDFFVVFWLPSFLFDFSMYIICLSFIMSVAVGIFVSRLISSWDVVGGVSSILFIMLLWVVSKFPSSFSVGIIASVPYSSVGMVHVSCSFNIVCISRPLSCMFLATSNMVCVVASHFPFICLR